MPLSKARFQSGFLFTLLFFGLAQIMGWAPSACAQEFPQIDAVIAVVGDGIVLESELEAQGEEYFIVAGITHGIFCHAHLPAILLVGN